VGACLYVTLSSNGNNELINNLKRLLSLSHFINHPEFICKVTINRSTQSAERYIFMVAAVGYCNIPIKSVFSDLFLVFEKNKNATEPISFRLKDWFSNTRLTNNNNNN